MRLLTRKRFDSLASLEPPRSLALQPGSGPWRAIGERWAGHFVEWGGLSPQDRVLEVGCGAGRMALALAPILGRDGSYTGFDVHARAIDWCRREIEGRWPGARFEHVDLHNGAYNPRGRLAANSFRFPYRASSFDFVFLTSVFTHMRTEEVDNYLREVARVLRPEGRVMCTWFLLDGVARSAIGNGSAAHQFLHPVCEGCLTDNLRVPEAAIAFDMEIVEAMIADAGLVISPPVRFGSWTKAARDPESVEFQDVLLLRRRG
jgi:SAM-dependent methyltransferase